MRRKQSVGGSTKTMISMRSILTTEEAEAEFRAEREGLNRMYVLKRIYHRFSHLRHIEEQARLKVTKEYRHG